MCFSSLRNSVDDIFFTLLTTGNESFPVSLAGEVPFSDLREIACSTVSLSWGKQWKGLPMLRTSPKAWTREGRLVQLSMGGTQVYWAENSKRDIPYPSHSTDSKLSECGVCTCVFGPCSFPPCTKKQWDLNIPTSVIMHSKIRIARVESSKQYYISKWSPSLHHPKAFPPSRKPEKVLCVGGGG